MTNNNFEKRIQEKLNQFEIEPSENLLENIFEKRAARSKGAFHFSYMKLGIAMLAILTITAVAIYNWPSSGHIESVSEFKHADQVPENTNSEVVINADGERKPNDLSTENALKVNTSQSALKTDVQGKNSHKDEYAFANGKIRQGKKFNQMESKQIGKTGAEPAYSQTRKSEINSEKIVQNKEEFNDNGYNIEARYFDIDAGNKPKISSVTHKGNSHLMVYQSVSQDRLTSLNLNYLFIEPIHTFPSDKSQGENIAIIDYKASEHMVNSRKPIFIDFMFTPFMTIHQADGNKALNENYGVMSQTVLNKQYNLRLSYPIAKNINVFTGIGYTNLYTYFKGNFEHSKNAVRYETVTNYINDPILGPIAVTHIDTINYIDKTPLKYDFKNTYQILNIPIGLSYNFGAKDFEFGIHGSAIFNVFTNSKGSNADFVNSQTESFDSNKKHLGLGGGVSFMVAYKLTNKIKFIAEPGLQFFHINSQKNGNAVNEKVFNSGLSFGLRYTLF